MGAWLFVMSHPLFVPYALFALVMSLYLLLSYGICLTARDFDTSTHLARCLSFVARPTVDVYLPCAGEPLEVLENTYKHVRLLNYPNSRLNVYVLDDSNSIAVKALALKYEFEYISRPNPGYLKKAGNLRYAFKRTEGQFFLVLDADFCPHRDFLLETLPYFSNDVAIVQTPQFFTLDDRHTWIEKGAAYVQELFYRLVQVSRDHHHAPICVGSNAVYRRAALEPFGGTAPIAYSEDVHTGFMVTAAGWRVRYVPFCLAKGMCPDTIDSYFLQQYRWATGSLTLFLNKDFWTSPLTVMQKICYLSGMLYYIATGMGVIFTVLPSIILVWFYPEMVKYWNAVFVIPSFLYGTIALSLWTRAPFGSYAFGARLVSQWAHLFAIVDKLRGELIPWQPSGAGQKVKRAALFKHLLLLWSTVAVSLVYFGAGLQADRLMDFAPTLFFFGFNFWVAVKVWLIAHSL
jgi:cellulose synthase/poly-beta-1,6-N-acetylglucosamine synthase-like glycosyltransferase